MTTRQAPTRATQRQTPDFSTLTDLVGWTASEVRHALGQEFHVAAQ